MFNQTISNVGTDIQKQVQNLFEALDDQDDVEDVASNLD